MRSLPLWIGLFVVAAATAQQRPSAVSYEVRYAAPDSQSIRVLLRLKKPIAGGRAFIMPRAVPMGYSQNAYDRFVQNLIARDGAGKSLAVKRGEGPRWILGDAAGRLAEIEYEVDLKGMEQQVLAGGDSSRVRPQYVFLLGYSIFGFVEGTEAEPAEIAVQGPAEWPVCATLAPASPCPRGQAKAYAPNFYTLADSQIQMGDRVSLQQVPSAATSPLFVSIYAEVEVDRARIHAATREAYEALVAYFGTTPFPSYVAVFEFLQPLSPAHTYGFSMEHLQSATFCLQPERALTAQSSSRDASLFRFNIAHHIAHAWVPKRAYGQGYFPFTWEIAPAHDSIWFSEGFGQFAALDALADGVPAGQRDDYFQRLLETRYRGTLREMPRFLLEMPLQQLSYRGSYLYSEDFRIGRTLFSRGALMAAEMDQRIREQSHGKKRLRDALRFLMGWTAQHPGGFRIEELPQIFQQATGVDTAEILEKWLGPLRPGMIPPALP